MSKSPFKATRGSWSSAFSTILGITLTLCLLGILSILALKGNEWRQKLKESMVVQVFLENEVDDIDIARIKKWIESENFTKQLTYVSPQEATAKMEEQLQEELLSLLDNQHPIEPSFDLIVHSPYADLDSLNWIKTKLLTVEGVKEAEYPEVELETIQNGLKKVMLPVLVVSALLMFIAIALINNTIRLSIFSKRFLIKSMQLVGATRGFIRRPFVWQVIWYGLISGLLAFSILTSAILFLEVESPDIFGKTDLITFAVLFGVVVFFGIFISWISTHFAVNKYLRLRQDQLY